MKRALFCLMLLLGLACLAPQADARLFHGKLFHGKILQRIKARICQRDGCAPANTCVVAPAKKKGG